MKWFGAAPDLHGKVTDTKRQFYTKNFNDKNRGRGTTKIIGTT